MNWKAAVLNRIQFRRLSLTLLGLVIAWAGVMAVTGSPAEAGFKQSNCKKLAKKFRKAKKANGSKARARKQRLRYRLKECKANRKAYNRVKNSRIVGERSDGQPVDITLCANGKAADSVGSPYQEIFRKGWRIERTRFRGKKYFEAVFSASLGRSGQQINLRSGAIKFSKKGWMVGIEANTLYNFGPAKRHNAKKICRKL